MPKDEILLSHVEQLKSSARTAYMFLRRNLALYKSLSKKDLVEVLEAELKFFAGIASLADDIAIMIRRKK